MKDQVDYKKKSQEIFKLINEYRKNPKSLSKYLESLKKYVNKDKVLCEPNKISIQMVEGVDVINEAIKFLNSLSSLPPFEWEPLLSQSAQYHVDDIGPKGELLYQSTDGTDPADRIGMFGSYVDSLGENIDFGPNDALGVIVSLTLDDGEDERPHRENLFNTSYRKIGIACGYHKTEFQMCVMDFAYDFLPLDDKKKYSQENDISQSHENEVSKHYGNNEYSYQNNVNESNVNVRNSVQKNQSQTQNMTGKKIDSQGQIGQIQGNNMGMSNNKNLEKTENKKVESNNNSKNIK